MTSPERKTELKLMNEEFDDKDTTEERRIEILTVMRGFANEEMPESKCVVCKQTGFYAPYEYALIEGHCYSRDGVTDYTRITKICEFCYDKMYEDDDMCEHLEYKNECYKCGDKWDISEPPC